MIVLRAPHPRSPFARLAPRLFAAQCAEVDRLVAEREVRRAARDRVLELEALVAHRELQEVRAATTRDLRYIGRRGRLLAEARRDLASARARLARLEAAW